MRTTERIILVLIALTWTMQPIIVVPTAGMRITERIVLSLCTRARTIGRITRGRGVRLLSTQLRSVRCNPIQPHLRTRLPNMQPRSMRLMRVPARSHLTTSTTRSRLTNKPMSEKPISCHRQQQSFGGEFRPGRCPWNGRRWPTRKIRWEHLIRLVRQKNDWTLRQMSTKVGIPLSTLAKVEADKLSLTYDKLQQFTSRLGMTLTEFLGQAESPDA